MSTGGMTNGTVLVSISTLLLRRKRYLCYHLFFMIPRGDLPTLEERIRYNKTDKSPDLWLLALSTHESHLGTCVTLDFPRRFMVKSCRIRQLSSLGPGEGDSVFPALGGANLTLDP